MRQALLLTVMYFRAYLRDRTALFFSLVVPLMLLLIFGSLNLGAFGKVSLAVDDQANNAASQQFVGGLEKIDTLSIRREPTDAALVAIMDQGRIVAMDPPRKLIGDLLARGFTKPVAQQQASLEDVFLDLTGHELREA